MSFAPQRHGNYDRGGFMLVDDDCHAVLPHRPSEIEQRRPPTKFKLSRPTTKHTPPLVRAQTAYLPRLQKSSRYRASTSEGTRTMPLKSPLHGSGSNNSFSAAAHNRLDLPQENEHEAGYNHSGSRHGLDDRATSAYLLTNYMALDEFTPCEREDVLGGVFEKWMGQSEESTSFASLMSAYCESAYMLNRVTLARDFPNAMSCAMSCDILDRLTQRPSKYQRVLQVLHEGILAGMYKDYSEGTSTYLEKTTWFSEAHRLEIEVEKLKREVAKLRFALDVRENLAGDEAVQDKICELFESLETAESQRNLIQFLSEQADDENENGDEQPLFTMEEGNESDDGESSSFKRRRSPRHSQHRTVPKVMV